MHSLPEEVGVCLREAAFCQVNSQHTQACLWTDTERTAALFPVSHIHPRHHSETKPARSSLPKREHQRRGHGREYIRSAQRRRRRAGSVHLTGSQSATLGRIENLLAENGPSRSPLCSSFAGMQV